MKKSIKAIRLKYKRKALSSPDALAAHNRPISSPEEWKVRMESLKDDIRSGLVTLADARQILEKMNAIGRHLATLPR